MNKKKERKERQREKERKGEDKTNKFEEVRFSNKKKNKVDLLEILIKATKNYVEKEINETSSLFNWYR